MLAKNFPATHQRDADFWTGLLDIGRWGPGRHRALFTKRAVSGWGRGCRARRGKRLNLSSHAKVRSTPSLKAWMASLNKRGRPRLMVLRLRGFSFTLTFR